MRLCCGLLMDRIGSVWGEGKAIRGEALDGGRVEWTLAMSNMRGMCEDGNRID